MGIGEELGVSSRTVYAAMDRHGIERRAEPGALKLRRPQLVDGEWLKSAVERGSSTSVAAELEVSAGTVTAAYERAGIDPASTTHLYERGRSRPRPSADQLRSAWETEGTFRGVGRRLGIAHTTAAVWLAEIGVFAETTPALPRSALTDGIERQWPVSRIATEHRVTVAGRPSCPQPPSDNLDSGGIDHFCGFRRLPRSRWLVPPAPPTPTCRGHPLRPVRRSRRGWLPRLARACRRSARTRWEVPRGDPM